MSASLRIKLSLSKIINPKLEVEYCIYQSDLKPKKKKKKFWDHLLSLCFMLLSPSTIKNPALARVNPTASFNTFASLDLHSVLGLLWTEVLRSGPWKKCKVRAKFNKKRRVDRSLVLHPLSTQVCSVKVFF